MKREKIKTPRGTARKLRRADMSVFRAERDKRREAENPGTHTAHFAVARGRAPERNPHGHSVATVTDMGDGQYVVRTYGWTPSYPANVPCPLREEVAVSQWFNTYGSAKEAADEINHITVAPYKPLLPQAA